ncbi:MAG: 1,2-phenylacetyl-CoA epoxidase subunit PaaC [Woeseiaceae bacterium]
MTNEQALLKYVLRLGDNVLVLAQRLIELVAHGPELEEELANANFALDYLGQARMFYTYAGDLEGNGRSEDDFAFMRPEREFCNVQLVEQPNDHFGDVIVRSFLFDAFYLLQLDAVEKCGDPRLAEIAARAIREIRYHQRYNSQWLIRLGDGTEESHRRVQTAIDDIWRYTGEMFAGDEVDQAFHEHYDGPDLAVLQLQWRADVKTVINEATIRLPEDAWMAEGGRQGIHTEHFGSLIAEMQTMQRSYPGLSW